jgi:hypothetical protein
LEIVQTLKDPFNVFSKPFKQSPSILDLRRPLLRL